MWILGSVLFTLKLCSTRYHHDKEQLYGSGQGTQTAVLYNTQEWLYNYAEPIGGGNW